MDEAQRGRVDAVAQTTAVARAVGENVAEMAVRMGGTHLGADHVVARVVPFADVRGLDRFGEAWPATAGFEFVGRGEERLAGDDVDINAGLVVVQVLAAAGILRSVLLRHAKLF